MKGKNGSTAKRQAQNLWSPRFCNTDFRLMLACLNLSGVYVGKDARATMSSAPDEPEKTTASLSHFCAEVLHQAVEPFMSSIISLRKTR